MSQTFAENKNSEDDKNECCICYNDNSEPLCSTDKHNKFIINADGVINIEEGNQGKLIKCCSNKHILCVGCFRKCYKIKRECPLCRELMNISKIIIQIMTRDQIIAYYELKQKREREKQEQQRQIRLAEAERQRIETERQRQQQLELIQVRKAERIQRIQQRNVELLGQRDEILGQIAINNAEIENINNLDLDAYYAMYSPYEVSSDTDTDDEIELERSTRPVFRTPPVQQVARPVARPVQQLVTPVARPEQPRPEQPRTEQPRRSRTYARDKLLQNEILVQILRGHRMVLRYDKSNDRFIRICDNTVYPTLNRANVAHAEEVGLSRCPNPWTTFKRLDGSRIDNL
jgi:hypothetical protein